ncbi:MAG: dihydrodipicolinate synthase family protein [Kiritimatiellae bacterium]|nr:dihydrodipicolinate synthase family protein [Kiritimatiellia bacterium]
MAGAFSAMFTPFTQDNRVNEDVIVQLIEYGIREGLKGFYLTGSTGEGLLLSNAERALVYQTAVKAARGRCKLIAQVGAVCTEDSVALAKAAADAGCDWISSVAPVYFGQSFEAQYRHYKMISEATDLPFLVYCFNHDLVPERDIRLFDLKNVKGMKYTGNDYYSVQKMRRNIDKEAVFYAGRDEQLLCALALGDVFAGGIGLNYNMIPRHFAMICALAAENDFRTAAKWQDEANRLVDLILEPGKWDNWSNFKVLMRHVGIDCGFCRAPYAPLSPDEVRERLEAFDRLGIVEKNYAASTKGGRA